MYVCMYVCMHQPMYVCMNVCIYPCMYACMYVCVYVFDSPRQGIGCRFFADRLCLHFEFGGQAVGLAELMMSPTIDTSSLPKNSIDRYTIQSDSREEPKSRRWTRSRSVDAQPPTAKRFVHTAGVSADEVSSRVSQHTQS